VPGDEIILCGAARGICEGQNVRVRSFAPPHNISIISEHTQTHKHTRWVALKYGPRIDVVDVAKARIFVAQFVLYIYILYELFLRLLLNLHK